MYIKQEQINLKTSLGKILVIEDNPNYQTLIKESLMNEFNITFETNDQVGLEVAKNITPNLLILNIQTLKIDADNFLKLLRENPRNSNMILILLTGTVNEECYMLARKYGVYVFTEWLFADKLKRFVKGLIDLKSLTNNQGLCL